ncbi:MAG: ABC transporter ATP-binding protein, partial [Thermoplasmata archaeon]|nr:ABC transporter ATP-binding protein [Thermoplasmata archaeon]
MIEVRDLRKDYHTITAIDGVSFHVDRGEILGLLGSNGAGKSTTIKILAGLLRPTKGGVFLAGYDVIRQTLESKRMRGYMPEFPLLYDNLTGYELLYFIGQLLDMREEEIKERIERYSEAMELEDHLYSLIGTYSKGTRQKITFIMAIMNSPPVLLLDEPTAGLDPRFTRLLKDWILSFRGHGTSILLSTHITAVAEDVCDRVAIIHRGKIRTMGAINDLLNSTGTESLEEAFVQVVDAVEGRDERA